MRINQVKIRFWQFDDRSYGINTGSDFYETSSLCRIVVKIYK